jgi:hypothetical protein
MKLKLLIFVILFGMLVGCGYVPPQTANDAQREQQAGMNLEGAKEVGMPNIVNFRDMRGVRFYYERRDQADLLTYTYTKNWEGQWVWYCDSIGYPISGGTQYSAPESMQRYRVRDPRFDATDSAGWNTGVTRLPQPEPNGVFPPSTAEGTGVICINPKTNKASAAYAEDKLNTFEWPQPLAIGEPDRSGPQKPQPKDPLAPPKKN